VAAEEARVATKGHTVTAPDPDPPIVRTLRWRIFELVAIAIFDLHYLALRLSSVSRAEARARAIASLRRALSGE